MAVEWDDLKTVLALVRGGSLAAAAKDLGLTYTTVARRIQRAETAHGGRLFERLKDGYRPTKAAQLVARHASDMEACEHHLLRDLAGQDDSLTGALTLTAPQLLIAHLIAPVIGDFCAAHPGVDLRIRATNDLLDLTRREADLAIRISRNPGDTLTGLRISAQHSASFAAPDWAARFADDPGAPIDWLVYEGYERLPKLALQNAPGSRVVLRFDDMVAMHGAACAGLGVVRMPMFLGRASPELVELPILPPQPYAEIWVVAHPDVWPSAKLEAFRAVLKSHRARIRAACLAD